jgi:asparagine synthase (glutamine-hydrolysing)
VRDGLALPLRLMLLDQATYLPDDLLVKIDRASMAVGLEARAPLLAREIVELSWRLPLSAKVSRSETKVALRTRLDRAIPPALRGQPKRGFSPPMDDWLRGPLRDWAENLLDPRRLRDEGFLDAEVVRETWRRHREGTHSLGPRLWCVLAFEGWLERMRERRAAEAAARARSGDGAPEVDSGADSG